MTESPSANGAEPTRPPAGARWAKPQSIAWAPSAASRVMQIVTSMTRIPLSSPRGALEKTHQRCPREDDGLSARTSHAADRRQSARWTPWPQAAEGRPARTRTGVRDVHAAVGLDAPARAAEQPL